MFNILSPDAGERQEDRHQATDAVALITVYSALSAPGSTDAQQKKESNLQQAALGQSLKK